MTRTIGAKPTLTGCIESSVTCRARNGAPTGCATGSSPRTQAPISPQASATGRRTDANTSASAAGASWSPANGHPRPSPGTAPTERTSFGPHSSRPASLLRTPTACPQTCTPRTAGHDSSGNRSSETTAPTPRSSCSPSRSAGAGGPSTTPPARFSNPVQQCRRDRADRFVLPD